MNAEQMLERNRKQARLGELLQAKPLEIRGEVGFEVRNRVNDLLELTETLAGALATATQSLIRQQEQIMVQQGAIETLANMIGAEKEGASGLVGFEKPSVILPN